MTLIFRALLPAMMFCRLALPAAADPTEQGWLDILMQRMAAFPAREADFVEQKRLAALNQPLISRGRLVYRRPSYIARTTTGAEPETLVADGERVEVAIGNSAMRVVPLESQPAVAGLIEGIRSALAGDLPALQRLYHVAADGDLTGWRLVLSPLGPPLATFLRSVTIEGTNTDVHIITIVQGNGDEQDMTLVPVTQ